MPSPEPKTLPGSSRQFCLKAVKVAKGEVNGTLEPVAGSGIIHGL